MYKIFAPAPLLRPFVEMYMVYRGQVPEGRSMLGPVPVDGQSDLVFNFGDPYERAVGAGEAADSVRQAVFDGPRTAPMRLWQVGYHFAVALRFQPGGLSAFTSIPSCAVSGQVIDASDVLGDGVSVVEDQLFRAGRQSFDAVPERLDAFLLDRLAIPSGQKRLDAALRSARASDGTATVADLAADVEMSARSLRRLFRERVGISPKVYLRALRLREALNRVWATDASLAQIAFDTGYADQSHFTREAVDLAGMSPGVARDLL
jgi:AraC-like DNA-binding protein